MTEWLSEWNRRTGRKILRNENPTTPNETCTAATFQPQIPHPSTRLKSGLHHVRPATTRLSHDKGNYGVRFVVNGIKSQQIS